MTAVEQYPIAEETKAFLAKWGLKKKFVARMCGIPEGVFSKFINNKVALSSNLFCKLSGDIFKGCILRRRRRSHG